MTVSPLKRLRIRGERAEETEEVSLTSLIDIFTMLLFFLLSAAVFSRIASLELNLPREEELSGLSKTPLNQEESILTLAITGKGFSLKDSKGRDIFIPLKDKDYDYETLSLRLNEIKEHYPENESIILLIEPEITYDIIIKTMDRSRELIIKENKQLKRYSLFPDISLADSIVLR